VTPDEIRQAVKADQQLHKLAFDGLDAELAKRLTFTEDIDRELTTGEILDLLGIVAGAALIATFRASTHSGVKELVRLLDGSGANIKHFKELVNAGVIDRNALKPLIAAMRVTSHPSADDVSAALRPWRPEGRAHQLVEN